MLAVYEKIQQLTDDIATLKAELQLIRISVCTLRSDLDEDYEFFDVKTTLIDGDIRLIYDRLKTVDELLHTSCKGCIFNYVVNSSKDT